MADLVTLAEFKKYLELGGTAHDAVLQDILDSTEALLEQATGQTFAPEPAADITDEPYDGTGAEVLFLTRPAASVTAVKIGRNINSPDETVVAADLAVDGWRLLRIDDGVFPAGRRNVFVSYRPAEYLPRVAKMAVLEGAAFLFRRRGREHVTGETVGEFGAISIAAQLAKQPAWSLALHALRVPLAR